MPVSSKNRRAIEIDGRKYLWWVAEDDESPFVPYSLAITVISDDRKFFIRYHLNQPVPLRHVTVLGSVFRDVEGCGGPWRRFRSPQFGTESKVAPGDIARLVRWSLERTDPVAEVDYEGRPLNTVRA